MSVISIILAALALTLILIRAARGNANKIGSVGDLAGFTQPMDLPAFLNLVDPDEEEFLRANLTPKVFRNIQRERLIAATEYVRVAARNAAVLVQLGETASVDANAEVSQIGHELVTASIRLRAFAFLALCLLYVRIAVPNTRLSLFRIPSRYQHVIEKTGHLVRLKEPAQASRILQFF